MGRVLVAREAQSTAQLDARQPRQYPIQQQQIGNGRLQVSFGGVAVGEDVDGVACLLEVVAQQFREAVLVLDDQDAHGH